MKNQVKKSMFFIFIFFLIALNLSLITNYSNFNSSDEEMIFNLSDSNDINLDESSLSVQYGSNIQEDRPYDFTGAFYDITNNTRIWSEDCFLETQFVLDSDVYSNDTISDLDNVESKSPDNSSYSFTHGSLYQNGTLDQLDNDYAVINSTNEYIEATNLTLNHGNLITSGNHSNLDGNYSEFNADFDENVFENFSINEGSLYQNGSLNAIDGNYSIYESTEATTYHHINGAYYSLGSYGGGAYSDSWVNDSNYFQMIPSLIVTSYGLLVEFYVSDLPSSSVYLDAYIVFSSSVDWTLYKNAMATTIISGTGTIISLNDLFCGAVNNFLLSSSSPSNYDCKVYFFEGYKEETAELNIETSLDFNIENRDLSLLYSYATDTTQTINMSIYNFDTSTFDTINSSSTTIFTKNYFLLNSSYYNSTNHVILNFVGANTTSDFDFYLEMLKIANSPLLEIESVINCDLFDNLIYAFKTNISQNIELYLYNFSSSSYELVDNSSYLEFNLNYTSILQDYHNGSIIKIKFSSKNTEYNLFSFYLDVLKVMNISKLDVIISISEFEYLEYLLNLNCSAWYYTSILTQVNLSIYDFENSAWILINSSSNDIDFFKSEYNANKLTLYDLIDSNNNNQILLRFHAFNVTNDFNLYLDCINLTIHRKLILSYEKEFNLLGTWKYRFNIQEDDYSTNWYYFDVIEHEDNFMAISESPYITKWILIGNDSDISTSSRFFDSIEGSYQWNLYDENDVLMYDHFQEEILVNGDSQVSSYYPNDNYGDLYYGYVRSISSIWAVYTQYTESEYFYIESYSDTILRIWGGAISSSNNADILETTDFDQNTITWNNKPSSVSTIESDFTFVLGYNFIPLGDVDEFLNVIIYPSISGTDFILTMEGYMVPEINQSRIFNNLYKFNQDDGFFVMQGNETEILKAKSEQFSSINLEANDYFLISCEATVENLELDLLYDGNIVDTYNVLVDNVDTESQLIEFSIDSDIIFDQIQFSGLFNDKEYFKCNSIEAIGHDSSTQEQITNFYVAPEESYTVLLDTGIHFLKIYDNDILRVEKTLNITHDIQENLEVYKPIYSIDCRLTLTNQEDELLKINLFEIYMTRTLSNTTSRVSLLDANFRVDLETTIYFEFYDRFSESIINVTKEAESFIFVEITIFSLKIKNDASNQSDIKITKIGSPTEIQDILAPDELYEYELISGEYSIEWLNHENNVLAIYNITLSTDYILTLPTSYFNVYFSLFNFDGLGLENEITRFYINNVRKNMGFNTLTQDVNNLKILDFFNSTLYTQDINLRSYSEYNIYVEIWNLIIENQYKNQSIRIEIERDDIVIEQVIQSQMSFNFRFLPEVIYEIRSYDLNGTLLDTKTIELDKNNKIISFGFYSEEVPLDPTPIVNDIYTMFWVVVIICVIISVLIFLHYRLKREVSNIPEHVKARFDKKNEKNRNSKRYDNRFDLG